ncbi:MAG: hypothetical protein ACRBC3_14600 [Burkholderiaceae bacterium]
MDIHEATKRAMTTFDELFKEQPFSNIALEEFDYDDATHEFLITVGFERNRKALPGDGPRIANPFGDTRVKREYKIVRVSDNTGQVLSIKNRPNA